MVYLIHFEKKFRDRVQHYVGFCEEGCEQSRLDRHRRGNGARLLQILNEEHIEYNIVRKWPTANKKFERRLKNQKNSKRFCPVCNPEGWMRRGNER